MTRNWIPLPRVEGTASRQAHADLPEGTYEREISKEGFFGPAAQFHHRHPPTGWIDFEGPLRPRAFDLNKLADGAAAARGSAELVLHNAASADALSGSSTGRWTELARNGDGDELLFVHEGAGELFCDYGHLAYRAGDYIVLPRGTMWRLERRQPPTALLIEATNDQLSRCRTRAWSAGTRSSTRRCSTRRSIDDAFRAQQDERTWQVAVKRRNAALDGDLSRSIRSTRWAGTAISRRAHQRGATSGR